MKPLVQFVINVYLLSDRINISLNLYGLWRDAGFLTKQKGWPQPRSQGFSLKGGRGKALGP